MASEFWADGFVLLHVPQAAPVKQADICGVAL